MSRKLRWVVLAVVLAAVGAAVWMSQFPRRETPGDPTLVRRALWFELQPVALDGCTLQRFGEAADGGYLLCAKLLAGATAGYSYGISGYDGWGCDVATQQRIPVHQYDCFNPTRPACEATTIFHDECVAGEPATIEGRVFDTLERQFARNGDGDARLVVKMDVEGAEWEAFLTAPDAVLSRIDQLVVEFHGTDERRFLTAIRRLKQYFHVANLHMNNHACDPALAPFPAWAYEVLLVSRRLAQPSAVQPPVAVHPLDRPNTLAVPDCQGGR